jgi:hypothetical protein
VTDKKDFHGYDSDAALDGQAYSQETLEIWLSAYLDGELSEEEESLLFKEVERQPALAKRLENLAQIRNICVREFSAVAERALTDRIMGAVAKEAAEPESLPVQEWASAFIDGELTDSEETRLLSVEGDTWREQGEAYKFVHAARDLRSRVASWASMPEHQSAFHECKERALQCIADGEQRALELQSYLDGEAVSSELEWLSSALGAPENAELVAAEVAWHDSSLQHTMAYLTAPAQWPEARTAGSAAMQAIEASILIEEEAKPKVVETASSAAEEGWMQQIWSRFRTFAAPTVVVAGLAALVVLLPNEASDQPLLAPKSVSNPSLAGERPWLDDALQDFDQKLQQDQEVQKLAFRSLDKMPLLSNNQAEVQTLETGGASTLVFGTAASNITVIWVSEHHDDMLEKNEIFGTEPAGQQGT